MALGLEKTEKMGSYTSSGAWVRKELLTELIARPAKQRPSVWLFFMGPTWFYVEHWDHWVEFCHVVTNHHKFSEAGCKLNLDTAAAINLYQVLAVKNRL